MVTAKLYAVVGVVIAAVVGSLLVGMLYYRNAATEARAGLEAAKVSIASAAAANAAQKETLDRLTANRAIDDKIVADLQGKLGELANQSRQATAAIRELERSNADVKSFLAVRLPDDLKRVLARGAASPASPGSHP